MRRWSQNIEGLGFALLSTTRKLPDSRCRVVWICSRAGARREPLTVRLGREVCTFPSRRGGEEERVPQR